MSRLLGSGQWQRLASGIYYAGSEEPPWLAQAWAGVLLGGDSARLGGSAAGHVHGIVDEAPAEIQVLVPDTSRVGSRPPWRFARERAGIRRSDRDDLSRITVEDTVLDLGQHATPEEMIGIVTRAVQRRTTSPSRLRTRLDQRRKVAHRALIQTLLGDVGRGATTPLEVEYLRGVERPHGLPEACRQVRTSGGEVQDLRYDPYGLVVELDGRLGHQGMGRFRDMRRDNRALITGLATLRYGWADVMGLPCQVAWQVGSVLTRCRWDGLLTRCRRCA